MDSKFTALLPGNDENASSEAVHPFVSARCLPEGPIARQTKERSLSEGTRAELMLELSGISHQEVLVFRVCSEGGTRSQSSVCISNPRSQHESVPGGGLRLLRRRQKPSTNVETLMAEPMDEEHEFEAFELEEEEAFVLHIMEWTGKRQRGQERQRKRQQQGEGSSIPFECRDKLKELKKKSECLRCGGPRRKNSIRGMG